jgi:hypothetical protein
MKRSRTVKILGLAAALLVPALAIAAFQVPHTYNPGDVLKADDLKVNFNALSSEIDSLRARLAAVESSTMALSTTTGTLTTTTNTLSTTTSGLTTTTNTLNAISLRTCKRFYKGPCDQGKGVECAVKCPTGWVAVSGGCDAQAGSALTMSAPTVAAGLGYPTDPNYIPTTTFDGWACQASTSGDGVMQTAHAFCCPP